MKMVLNILKLAKMLKFQLHKAWNIGNTNNWLIKQQLQTRYLKGLDLRVSCPHTTDRVKYFLMGKCVKNGSDLNFIFL